MVKQTRSKSAVSNPAMLELERGPSQNNLEWGEQAVYEMGTGDDKNWTYVVLLGGSDTMSFRLRVAQSHIRNDMLPSYWSESILVELKGASVSKANAIHVPLLQPEGPEFPTRSNGVRVRSLRDYADPQRYPNIAVIALPVAQAEILKRVEAFRNSKSTLDALEHVLRWLAFCWGAAATPNPLHDNYGFPSACMLETVFAAANLDLTPGLEARASCPEAIWVAARFWQDYFEAFRGAVPQGRYWTPHAYAITEPDDGKSSNSKKDVRASASRARTRRGR
ncbi:hypothetical protein [Viridibacterium curvum]|uniref:Uncharacterized protein n=1 Tax=Viridibacterium curvum TaxID=1101404 RepID=A0ABP9QRG5_9RHOO